MNKIKIGLVVGGQEQEVELQYSDKLAKYVAFVDGEDVAVLSTSGALALNVLLDCVAEIGGDPDGA